MYRKEALDVARWFDTYRDYIESGWDEAEAHRYDSRR
jgi:hypothetical protein